MRHFRGRPLSWRVLVGRTLLMLGLVFVCALIGWLAYTPPLENSQANSSDHASATAPADTPAGPARRPNP
jgi:hypothetical protein